MFPTVIPDRRVYPIIDQRQDARAVPQERPSPRHRVEHGIQPQPRRRIRRHPRESLPESPRPAEGQREQVRRSGPVTQVVGEPARRQRGLGTGKSGERGVFEFEVGDTLVQTCEGVQRGGVESRREEAGNRHGLVEGAAAAAAAAAAPPLLAKVGCRGYVAAVGWVPSTTVVATSRLG